MKKIILILLMFIICLPTFAKPNYSYTINQTQIQTPIEYQGAYVNEEITTPITQIGIPQELITVQEEEKELEISWNQWRADVFNNLSNKIDKYNLWGDITSAIIGDDFINRHPENCVFMISATVSSEGYINNIITLIIKEKGMQFKNSQALVTKNTSITMYSYNDDMFYSLYYLGEPININEQKTVDDGEWTRMILSNCRLVNLNNYTNFDRKYSKKKCEQLKKLSGEAFLAFPVNSKRKYTNIYHGMTDIEKIITVKKATADMYNDVEK